MTYPKLEIERRVERIEKAISEMTAKFEEAIAAIEALTKSLRAKVDESGE